MIKILLKIKTNSLEFAMFFAFFMSIIFLANYFISDNTNTCKYFEEYSYSSEVIEQMKVEIFDQIFELRLENYKSNIVTLKGALLNMVIIVMLGLLLLFYRPDGIQVSFIKLKIPESLLYILVIFGSLYTWAIFGLEFNSAVDSRLTLHKYFDAVLAGNKISLDYEQWPHHILVDNALIDLWCSRWFGIFDKAHTGEISKHVFKFLEWFNLIGLYITLFGILFAIAIITSIEFGKRIKESKFFNVVIVLLTYGLLITSTLSWGFGLHIYASGLIAFCWFICGIAILLWILKGDEITETIKSQKTVQKE